MKTLAVNIQVSGKNCDHIVKIKRMSAKDTSPISIGNLATSADESQWPHLASVDLPDLNDGQVDLSIE